MLFFEYLKKYIKYSSSVSGTDYLRLIDYCGMELQLLTCIFLLSVDHITIPSRCGKGVLRRVPEVFDCWFESGSMPYAQVHYPFENKREFEDSFPADFIAEGIDQTRGW